MRGKQDRRASIAALANDLLHSFGGDWVEAGERFVEDQQIGVMHQRDRELHALLIATREFLHEIIAPLGQTDPGEPVVGSFFGDGFRQPGEPSKVDDLFERLHSRIQTAFLGHVPNGVSNRFIDWLAVPCNRSRLGRNDVEDHPHRGGLARTIRAKKPNRLARTDGEINAINGANIAKVPLQTPYF